MSEPKQPEVEKPVQEESIADCLETMQQDFEHYKSKILAMLPPTLRKEGENGHKTLVEKRAVGDTPKPEQREVGAQVCECGHPILEHYKVGGCCKCSCAYSGGRKPTMPLDKQKVFNLVGHIKDMVCTNGNGQKHIFIVDIEEYLQQLESLCQPREVSEEEVEKVYLQFQSKWDDDQSFRVELSKVIRHYLTNQPDPDAGLRELESLIPRSCIAASVWWNGKQFVIELPRGKCVGPSLRACLDQINRKGKV